MHRRVGSQTASAVEDSAFDLDLAPHEAKGSMPECAVAAKCPCYRPIFAPRPHKNGRRLLNVDDMPPSLKRSHVIEGYRYLYMQPPFLPRKLRFYVLTTHAVPAPCDASCRGHACLWHRPTSDSVTAWRLCRSSPFACSWAEVMESLFYVHNETGNIYSHLFCFALFAGLAVMDVPSAEPTALFWLRQAFFWGMCIMAGTSASYHLARAKSKPVFDAVYCADLGGIVFILATAWNWTLRLAFFCEPRARFPPIPSPRLREEQQQERNI